MLGAELYVADIREEVHDFARELGAAGVAKSITDFADVGLDVIGDFAGVASTTSDAIATVRPHGRVVLVGMSQLEATIGVFPLMLNQVDLCGSLGGTREDVQAVVDAMAEGKIKMRTEEITWEQIPEGLEKLEKGEVIGRLIVNYPASDAS